MSLVTLLLGFAGFAGYGQVLHTPYPIIFVHGLNSNYKTWSKDGPNHNYTDYNDVLDYLEGTGLKPGGILNISLNYTRNSEHLNVKKIDDVKLFTINPEFGDFYTINFDVHATKGIFTREAPDYATVLSELNKAVIFDFETQIYVSHIDQFRVFDIIRIGDELMEVIGINPDNELVVNRGKISTKSSIHLVHDFVYNLSTEGNQASIAKQGWGLKLAVDAIKAKTNAKKVILVGHSMGGLAAREYIQSDYYENDVVNIITIGTPHYGSDISDLPNFAMGLQGIDGKSEAIRDLRTLIQKIYPIPGVYLGGGDENSLTGYYSNDVNCNGSEKDYIEGLNQFVFRHFPENIHRKWIVSSLLGLNNDGIVLTKSQFIYSGDTIRTNGFHTSEPTDYYALLRGLDEPDEKDFAYEIGEKSTNKGFITFGANNNPVDIDLYKVALKKDGKLSVNITGNDKTGITMFRILDEDQNSLISETNINNPIEYEAKSGEYYIQIRGIATNNSYQYPYTLNTSFIETPPAAMSVSPTSLQFYDVVMTSPKNKTVTLTNNGNIDILMTGISLTGIGADQFTVSPLPPFAVTPELPQNITVTFNPTSIGSKEATIEITTNSPDIPVKTVSLKGNGTDHETKVLVCSQTNPYIFSDTKINLSRSKTFTIQNTGSNACTVSGLTIEGLNPDPYSITSPSVIPFSIASGESKQITVKFAPASVGSKSATLAITNNSDNLSPKLSIELLGNGTENYYSGSTNNLIALEYWFDDQYQSKVNTPVITLFSSDLVAQIQTDGLTSGLRTIHIRYKDQNGKWSSVVSEFFYKRPVSTTDSLKIVASEYWFDDDYSTKISTAITPGQTVNVNGGFDVSSLSNGLHIYHVRYKDNAGQWSSVVSEFFNKIPTAAGVRKITASEYWFDDGYSTKVTTAITQGQTITLNSGFDVSSLSNGLHIYHVRFKDDTGQWSSVVSEFFNKMPVSAASLRKITDSEYWFDDDYSTKISTAIEIGRAHV